MNGDFVEKWVLIMCEFYLDHFFDSLSTSKNTIFSTLFQKFNLLIFKYLFYFSPRFLVTTKTNFFILLRESENGT